eukprot:2619339-Prorocentrum_lima.AAC.1
MLPLSLVWGVEKGFAGKLTGATCGARSFRGAGPMMAWDSAVPVRQAADGQAESGQASRHAHKK